MTKRFRVCLEHLLYLPCQDCKKEESVTDNPFKVGDKVKHTHFGEGGSTHEVLAVRGQWLWLDDSDDDPAPYTAYADRYVKAEEPIMAGQRWQRVGDSYSALIREVTDKHVIYEVSHWGPGRPLARTVADFRKEYTR